MKAVIIPSPGGADQLQMGEWEKPAPRPYEILVKVAATAVNRADILQREGKYPPPKGASPILGLEMSGEVVATGSQVMQWKTGDQVFGLLPGGGYAEYAVIHEDMAMPVPGNISLTEAAAIPEVFLTAFQALHWLAHLQEGESALIHAGGSGVGTAAIQLAKQLQAGQVLVTASAGKHPTCLALGADIAIDYHSEDFQEAITHHTSGRGVDVILDFIAAPYFEKNIHSLHIDGRLILLAALGGGKVAEFDLRKLLQKRLQVTASTLRSRHYDYQIKLTQNFASFAIPKFQQGLLRPVIDRIFDWKEVREAHRYMESNQNTGKIVLQLQMDVAR